MKTKVTLMRRVLGVFRVKFAVSFLSDTRAVKRVSASAGLLSLSSVFKAICNRFYLEDD